MSYIGFDNKIENEIIILDHLFKKDNDEGYYYRYEYFDSWKRRNDKEKKEKNKSEEEIKKEVEKEILEEKEKLIKESHKKYYTINEEKNKELDDFFKSSKLKVILCNTQFLGNGKICGTSGNKYIIYETTYMNKLYEIQFDNIDNIKSVIELDNHDLIFISTKRNKEKKNIYSFGYENDYELFIYRLKNKKYYLFQRIKEDRNGYEIQNSYSGCFSYPKSFSLIKMQKLSGNRFLSISNYGFRLYSLNDNNQYSLVLKETHLEGIEIIYEIKENQFIFCTRKSYGASMGGPSHDYLLIEKLVLKEINNKKLACSCETLFKYCTYGGSHRFSNFLFLENEYFLILVDNHLLIFDILRNKLIKRFTILENGIQNLYNDKFLDILKWEKNDNEFLIIKNGNITLLEFNENDIKGKIDIDLKIVGYSYFDKASYLKTDENNRFYIKNSENDDNDCILFY